jgi:glutathione S-transferase
MLALYHFGPVANSLTPLLGLLEKGLPFENRFLNSRQWEHHDPAFRQLSPDGMVPVLVRTEMRVLTKYVDEYLGMHNATAFASKVDPDEKARRLAAMPNAELRKKWEKVFDRGYGDEELTEARGKLARVAERMEAQLAHGGDRLHSKEYSLADIKWYSMVPGLPGMTPELCNAEATPRIAAWLARMGERPAVQALAGYGP